MMSLHLKNTTKFVLFLAVFISSAVIFADDILNFYVERAKNTFKSRDPFENGISFSHSVKSYFKKIIDDGQEVLIDSSRTVNFYSFGKLDSSVTVYKAEKYSDPVNLVIPDIFSDDYYYYFFPNDTGGDNLSIGYDTRDFDKSRPVGFAVIDRNRYFYRWLYLYFVNDRRDKRNSRWLRFVEHEGFIFPDSIWELKAVRGVFSTDYYRIETSISDIEIYR